MSGCAVVIAASNLMPALRGRLVHEGELLAFADTEPIQALQTILVQRPRLIVLERLFAATPRGAALINRIKTDPQLNRAEVRVMSHSGDYSRQVIRPGGGEPPGAPEPAGSHSSVASRHAATSPLVVEEAVRQIDWHGTRRAPRYKFRRGVDIQLDGNPATVVDMSVVGAQVVSATILRPNQKVRVSIATDEFMMRFRAAIAWAKFELPRPADPPQYRAGLEFIDADVAAMEAFSVRHRE
jgi:hypothetical protein